MLLGFPMNTQTPIRLLFQTCRQPIKTSKAQAFNRSFSAYTYRPLVRGFKLTQIGASQYRNISATMSPKEEDHQHQSGTSTERDIDQWKKREPYRVHEKADNFDVKWEGQCHCGKVQYQLSRDKPLAAKYCHCTTCQRLHGVSCVPSMMRA